jgi:hypothetical protein
MRATMNLCVPEYDPSDRRREAERRKVATSVARQIIVEMVQAGWRECEAALSLADAFDDYCLYLAELPQLRPKAANGNTSHAAR